MHTDVDEGSSSERGSEFEHVRGGKVPLTGQALARVEFLRGDGEVHAHPVRTLAEGDDPEPAAGREPAAQARSVTSRWIFLVRDDGRG